MKVIKNKNYRDTQKNITMKQYEYMKVNYKEVYKGESLDIKELNHLGALGWQFVCFTYVNGKVANLIFKRAY